MNFIDCSVLHCFLEALSVGVTKTMNPSDLEILTLNRKRKANSLLMKNAFKKTRFYQSYQPQNWTFPDSIIYYIATNPSTPKLYQKMIQSCKYFFAKNPIIICDELIYFSTSYISHSNNKKEQINIWRIHQKSLFKNINLNQALAKLWIVNDFRVIHVDMDKKENVVSSIFPMIYQCDAYHLNFYRQLIFLEQYVFLVSNATKIDFSGCIIKNDDGSIVPLEKLVEHASKAKDIIFNLVENNTGISPETVKNLLKLPHFSTLNLFMLEHIPDSLDVETLFFYIKVKGIKHTKFNLYFSPSISDTYKNRLQKIVDEILDHTNRNYLPPWITFPGQNNEKYQLLTKLCIEYQNVR